MIVVEHIHAGRAHFMMAWYDLTGASLTEYRATYHGAA